VILALSYFSLEFKKDGLLEFGCLVVHATVAMADLASTVLVKYSGMIAAYMRKVWVEVTIGGCN
jgi:hypothetical protein